MPVSVASGTLYNIVDYERSIFTGAGRNTFYDSKTSICSNYNIVRAMYTV